MADAKAWQSIPAAKFTTWLGWCELYRIHRKVIHIPRFAAALKYTRTRPYVESLDIVQRLSHVINTVWFCDLTDWVTWFDCKLVFANCISIFPKYIRVAIDRWSEMGPGRLLTDISRRILLHWHIWRMSHGKCLHRPGGSQNKMEGFRRTANKKTENGRNIPEVIWQYVLSFKTCMPFDMVFAFSSFNWKCYSDVYAKISIIEVSTVALNI